MGTVGFNHVCLLEWFQLDRLAAIGGVAEEVLLCQATRNEFHVNHQGRFVLSTQGVVLERAELVFHHLVVVIVPINHGSIARIDSMACAKWRFIGIMAGICAEIGTYDTSKLALNVEHSRVPQSYFNAWLVHDTAIDKSHPDVDPVTERTPHSDKLAQHHYKS